MDEIIIVNEQFYILATSPMIDDRAQVLKQGETFAVFDRYGDIQTVSRTGQGLYYEGTRFLSRLELSLGDDRPVLLSSTLKPDNTVFTIDLTNPDVSRNGSVVVPRGTLHLLRTKFLWQGACYERLRITNYGTAPLDVAFSYKVDADFADIFEVRGRKRERRGRRLPQEVMGADGMRFAYIGLDGIIRCSSVKASPPPASLSSSLMTFERCLQPHEEATFSLVVTCESSEQVRSDGSYDRAARDFEEALTAARADDCMIGTSNEPFNEWLNRSFQDIHMMVTNTPDGPYPYAGLPWFCAPFGRDGIITALEYLWVNPKIAKGVLAYLAATQATDVIPEQEAEPGKILHETRKGEMAMLDEIPFRRYYGSVDATPLFIVLAGAYYKRTGDEPFIATIWPNIVRALEWIDIWGDRDGDGFVEYARLSPGGLVHQGWKDSRNAVFHADGSLAEGPIALCEVQGYVYAAKLEAAELASVLKQSAMGVRLSREAHRLQERFEGAFWCDELSMYALALDARKRQCRVRASNSGHCLLSGIAGQDNARRNAQSLLGHELFSGWGIRTVATSEARFNPMSYHNGSVWPHDNALIAMGLARYGYKEAVLKILTGLFEASLHVDLHRLPELFCGFVRRPGGSPTLYPVACAPQAWSAASVFFLLQACLGLTIHPREGIVQFSSPRLPSFLEEIAIKNLEIGRTSVDLLLQRHGHEVGIDLVRSEGRISIIVE